MKKQEVNNKVLIIGGTSAIARSAAFNFVRNGCHVAVTSRKLDDAKAVADDLKVRTGADVIHFEFKPEDLNNHKLLFDELIKGAFEFDYILIAHGTLPDNNLIKNDVDKVLKEFNINFLSVISIATIAAEYFETVGRGTIGVITSVAGDRARQSNYIYGTAKGAVSLYLQGLRNRLFSKGIKVVTIKPGFVDTPMTATFKKNALFAKPDVVGKQIYEAMLKSKDIVYVPGFWRLIMFIIKHIPESIFKKLNL